MLTLNQITLLDCAVVAAGVAFVRWLFTRKPALPLPPGPKGWPLIGNVLDMPSHHAWFRFTEWGKLYGEITHVRVLGQSMVVLNSLKAASEMLDKKSAIYSDRPTFTMGGEIVGFNDIMLFVQYGPRFREMRRFMHRFVGGKLQMERFHPVVDFETRKFLKRVLKSPDEVAAHIRKTSGAIILKLAYGYEVVEGPDPMVDLVETATAHLATSATPGTFLVDVFPALRHVPAWFPGAGWKRLASVWRQDLKNMTDIPFGEVRKRMADETNIPNWTSELLENEGDAKEFSIKWTVASLYSGGADTTVSAIYSFILAMTLYPEIQRRAQEEIDMVVGNDRLPTFEDRAQLPYVEALFKEVLRWNPVTPIGAPHQLREDDVWGGYRIPKGSMVVANVWGILHDPDTYSDPFTFNPARFLPDKYGEVSPDPQAACFGFGRRICPGLHLADASVFISCAATLAVFDISKAVEGGKVVEPSGEYTTDAISHPEPFKCTIKPRSAKAEALILASGDA